ncbi:MAG: ATP-dependent Clp protease proteolytic subunit [Alphaproteobacteria bacterium]|nr:ATP-dependent Clp protease proteolytic subunit [Alphaproteobacteria bacterium]MCD8520440.1 ATP-dependent Clp protease proteolytic subunit [Alphaproteobacteria bacterium]MCD8526283.1 ATP-dependent Clp protease proteolytic subunit [Alphaproteobacteria bacterium]MCD8571127.1 ATP-dependent Clp protease proteolytic subunit [Alphaproteobacteria bacterium]
MITNHKVSRLAAVGLGSIMAAAAAHSTPIAQHLTNESASTPISDPLINEKDAEENKWTVRLTGAIDRDSAIRVINQLKALSAKDPHHEITLRINSAGGGVVAGFSIYDVMQRLPNDIRTVCEGEAQSMAFVLLSAGTPGKREVLPHCTLMAHQVSGGVRGRVTDLPVDYQDLLKLNDQLVGILSRHSGWSMNHLKDFMQRDLILTPEEAIAMNFIDQVRQPSKQPEINRAPVLPEKFCDKTERSYIDVCDLTQP